MIDRFLEYLSVERKYSPYTVQAYGIDLREFCSFLNVDPHALDPAAVSEQDVKLWLVDLLDVQKQTPRTVKRKLCSIKSFYKFLLRSSLVERDVTRSVLSPKIGKTLPVFFKQSEMQQATMYEQAADDWQSVRDGLIIQLLYQTGMRQAEMLGLHLGDVDVDGGSVRVFGKRSKERIIPIGDQLIAQIRNYLEFRSTLEYSGDDFFLIETRRKGIAPLTKSALYNIVCTRMGEVSSLKKHSPHVLRHTFATTMLNNGADIRTIQTLLGHSSLAATQVYTHTTFEQLDRVYRAAHPREKK